MTASNKLAAACLAVLTAAALPGITFAAGAPNAEQSESAKPATSAPAHVAARQGFAAVLDLKSAVDEAIKRNDLPALTQLHDDIEQRLWSARRDMDRAFLTGAWRSAGIKQSAALLLGQAEGVQMLNFISLAFLKGYDSPTGKVSASIVDANGKMFLQLGQLLHAMDALDTKALSRARREAR